MGSSRLLLFARIPACWLLTRVSNIKNRVYGLAPRSKTPHDVEQAHRSALQEGESSSSSCLLLSHALESLLERTRTGASPFRCQLEVPSQGQDRVQPFLRDVLWIYGLGSLVFRPCRYYKEKSPSLRTLLSAIGCRTTTILPTRDEDDGDESGSDDGDSDDEDEGVDKADPGGPSPAPGARSLRRGGPLLPMLRGR